MLLALSGTMELGPGRECCACESQSQPVCGVNGPGADSWQPSAAEIFPMGPGEGTQDCRVARPELYIYNVASDPRRALPQE